MHYLLFYEVGEDYVTKRAAFREEHLEKAWKASERRELLLGGAFANPVDGAVLLFQGNSPQAAEKFAEADACARLCHLAGGELEQIQFLLGHASVETTERYLGCRQRLSNAVNDNLGLEDT